MPLECPKCKSPVARDGQRFCYRCGHDLNEYYESLKGSSQSFSQSDIKSIGVSEASDKSQPKLPAGTVVLEPNAFNDAQADTPQPSASLRILLPTGDVFDRDIGGEEIQIGKGPRNDLVIADPSVSTAHAVLKFDQKDYTIADLGSRNGTFVNGDRVTDARKLAHGDVIGMGLSKLTFRLADSSETGSIELDDLAKASKPSGPPPLTEESLALVVVSSGLVSRSDLDNARAKEPGRRLYRALVEGHIADEERLRDLMSRTFEIPLIDLESAQFDDAAIAEFPARLALEHAMIPVSREGEVLVLPAAAPTDAKAIQQVSRQISASVKLRLATASQIRVHTSRHYGPKLIGVLPTGDKLEYLIDKHEVEIGKAAHNQIVLSDPTVSNTHAILIAREGGYSIVDLGSRNGTFVNGERLGATARTLRHGETIQLGQTVLTFRNPGETAANVTAVLSEEALREVRRRAGIAEAKTPAPQASNRPAVLTPPPPAPESKPASNNLAQQASSSEAADALLSSEEKEEKKKKKKKKKKVKDDRLRAAYISAGGRIFAAILSVALTVALTLYLTRSGSSPLKEEVKLSKKGHPKLKLPNPGAGTIFQGGAFEASGVVQVPGTDGLLVVDDQKLDEILFLHVDETGRQSGPQKPIALGASVADLEAITYGNGYFFATGSQSDPKDGEKNAIARFKFDIGSQSITGTEVIPNFRAFLLSNVPALKDGSEKSGKDGGLNIEGLAWDPKRSRLILGLRSPQVSGSALIVSLTLQNPSGSFSIDNLRVGESQTIPLEGLGIRDIQFDSRLDAFLIISGAPEHHDKKLGFKLWQWNGETVSSQSDPALLALTDLDTQMKPEGITHVDFKGHDFIFIVGDAGSYIKLDLTESE